MTNNRIAGARRPLLGLLVVGLVAFGCTFATAARFTEAEFTLTATTKISSISMIYFRNVLAGYENMH